MFYTYVLYSALLSEFYIGSTGDLRARFGQHQRGENFSTKNTKDWTIVYYEAYTIRKLAFRREAHLKKRAKAWQELKKRILENKR